MPARSVSTSISDQIIEEGKFTGPDSFMDLALASNTCVQYYNLYVAAKLEEDKAQMLRRLLHPVPSFKQAAMAPPPQAPAPTANPMPAPVSPLVPNGANQGPIQ